MNRKAGELALYLFGVFIAAIVVRIGWEVGEKLWKLL